MNEQLAKFFAGESSQAERQEILAWRSENRENAEAFLEAKAAWVNSEKSSLAPDKDVLQDILKTRTMEQSGSSFTWVRYAAIIVSVLGLAFWFYAGNDTEQFNLPLATTHTLEDGSVISLHGESSYEVVEMSSEQRVIKLEGKAFFDIERDESRPFLIQTTNTVVSVLGTSFLVEDEPNVGTTRVMVTSGKVAFEAVGEDKSPKVYLERGDQATWKKGAKAISKQKIRDSNYLAWNTGLLTFKNSNLTEVGSILNDVYDLEVSLENPKLKNCKLTAKFNQRPVEEVVKIIANTFNLEYTLEGKKATFSGKACK